MRVVFAILGAVFGLSLASGSREFFGVVLGALVGFALAELLALRTRSRELEDQVSALRKLVSQQIKRATADPSAQSGATVTPTPPAAAVRVQPDAAVPVQPNAAPPAAASKPVSIPRQAEPLPPPAAASDPGWAGDSGGGDVLGTIVSFIRDYFTGGNTLVRVGVIILFFGVAFLLRYAAEHSHVPIELRLAGVAAGGLALLVLGWRLRARRPGYALALQGGAVGILYLTVFAGLRLYSVLPAGAAFPLLVLIAALSAVLAILQSSQSFALLGVSGGFLAPILASTGQGSHVVLFSYYAVLNAGILAIAWFKAWRALNLAGFLFTFVIGTVWGVLSYRAALFASTEPFLILFFLFYVAIAILFATRQAPELRGYVDGTLVFGNPLIAFGLQAGMLHDRRFELAYSALAVSALYLGLATVLHRTRQQSQRLIVEAFMALGVLFLTLAVPLALDGRWSSATWAVEGAALVWIGCRQNRRLPRAFGALLQIAGGVIFLSDLDAPIGTVPILNSTFLSGVMVSAASVFAASMLERNREKLSALEPALIPVLFFWGVLWWLFAGLTEIHRRIPARYEAAAGLLFMGISALICGELRHRARLEIARYPALALLPAMMLYAGIAVLQVHHPFADGGWLAWPLAFAAFYFVCRRNEGAPGAAASALHVGSAWLLTALLSWEVAWAIDRGVAGGGSWPTIAWALIPAITLHMLPKIAARGGWPVGVHRRAYIGIAAIGVAVYLAAWSLKTNVTLRGDPYPLPFVPLLNPLDLAELFVLLVLLRFFLHLRSSASVLQDQELDDRPVFASLALLAFVWLNAALLRTLHHWQGIPFQIEPMIRSTLVETSLSIFWTVIALLTMLIATRKGARVVWLTGAALLGVVIAKLFLVDLSRVGTIERIVSFVGVGVLMLVIGYFSPLPPAITDRRPESRGAGA